MFCRNCGAELPDHAVICTRCGAAVANDRPANEPNTPNGYNPEGGWNPADNNGQFLPGQNPGQQYPPQWQYPGQGYYGQPFSNGPGPSFEEIRHTANVVLAWGIVSVFFSMTIYLSLLGVIFSILGIVKAKKYRQMAGPETGSALAGKVLSIIGLCTGIVMMIVFFVVMGYVGYTIMAGSLN